MHINYINYYICRGILQSGPYTSSLWKGPTATTKFNYGNSVSYDKNPCVPCNNNPDPYAVQITFHFPRYTYPVFFPSSAPETCSFLLKLDCFFIVTVIVEFFLVKKEVPTQLESSLINYSSVYLRASYQCRQVIYAIKLMFCGY